MKFSLQRLVAQTLAEAEHRVKLAEAEDQKDKEEKKESGSPAKPASSNESTTPERNEEGITEKTATVFVEKLAAAVEYLNTHYLSKEAVGTPETIGAGKGTGALETNLGSPTPGEQSETTGQAKHDQVPMTPGSDVKSPGQVNPATAMETDINSPPGGSEDWTNKDKMKQGAAALKARVSGLATKGRKEKEGCATKEAQVAYVLSVMQKMAGDIEEAKISAGTTNPHQHLPEGATQSEEGVPSQPGEVNKQDSMISSNKAAIDYTKQQAKAVPKARMGEVIDEPAQKKSTDPVLHQNLDATSEAGVKISSAQALAAGRALLTKIAEEGAREDASPEEKERALKLQELLQAKQKEKESQGMGGPEATGMPLGGGF